MFEHKLLKTIKDTALQSHRILQVCAPHLVLPTLPDNLGDSSFSLRRKRFVWFQSKERPRKGILGFGRERNETSTKKWRRVRGRRRNVSFLYAPPPPHSFAFSIFTLVPHSLLQNCTETLATQATQVFGLYLLFSRLEYEISQTTAKVYFFL